MIKFIKDNKILALIILLNLIYFCALFFYDSYAYVDSFEHLRMGYLVSEGQVPYRDFFEHHHPLLWYVIAPIMKILPHKAVLAYHVAKILALLCSVTTYYLLYLIFRHFLGGKILFWCFLLCAFAFSPVIYGFSLFKPEVFARLFYVLGLYLFFVYAETYGRRFLVMCGVAFCIAFFFIQTAVFCVLPLAFPLAVLCLKNKRSFIDAGIAFLVCLSILGLAVTLLYYNGAWTRYYETNWIINKHLFNFLYNKDASLLWFWLPYYLAALAIGIHTIKTQPSFYYNTIFWLFCCSLLQHIYFPAIHPHYLIWTSTLAAIVLAPDFMKLIKSDAKFWANIFLLFSFAINIFVFLRFLSKDKFAEMMTVNKDETAQCVVFDFSAFNVYAPQISYYVMFNNLHYLDDLLFHAHPEYNLNQLIKKHKPQYLNISPKGMQISALKYPERFAVTPEIMQDYRQIAPRLFQRIDTISATQ